MKNYKNIIKSLKENENNDGKIIEEYNFSKFNLNEIDFNLVKTKFVIYSNNNIEKYDFISKNGNSYSVYFQITTEKNIELSNGIKLINYTKLNQIPTIFFSLTNRGLGTNFDKLSNKNEELNVMGSVVYIILNYINNHNYTTYSIGEVNDSKINFYNYYRKYFNDFTILTGKSENYKDKNDENKLAYYLVEKGDNEILPDEIKLDENCILKIN